MCPQGSTALSAREDTCVKTWGTEGNRTQLSCGESSTEVMEQSSRPPPGHPGPRSQSLAL